MRKQSVILREKKLKNGRKSLYLDIWSNGKRSYEFLKLYLEKPVNTLLRDENRRTRQLAETIRAKRQIELQNEAYDVIKQAIKDTPDRVGYLINLLLISRHLERIADHATNIAEEVVYIIEGEIVRHGKLEKEI